MFNQKAKAMPKIKPAVISSEDNFGHHKGIMKFWDNIVVNTNHEHINLMVYRF